MKTCARKYKALQAKLARGQKFRDYLYFGFDCSPMPIKK